MKCNRGRKKERSLTFTENQVRSLSVYALKIPECKGKILIHHEVKLFFVLLLLLIQQVTCCFAITWGLQEIQCLKQSFKLWLPIEEICEHVFAKVFFFWAYLKMFYNMAYINISLICLKIKSMDVSKGNSFFYINRVFGNEKNRIVLLHSILFYWLQC